ncbi:leucine-rich repeat protein [Flavobacteriaceae bacterium]|nr:leucine-rich repeat protein [Flavobacteriaceae bacterium]
MIKHLQKPVVTLLFLLSIGSVNSQTFTADGFSYTVTSDTNVSISKGENCPEGTVTIPATVTHSGTEYTVRSIGAQAFDFCTDLTAVSIPDTVTSIGDGAFVFCALESISIPDSVVSVGNGAFGRCDFLTSVTIGNAVTAIGRNTFMRCRNLSSVTIGNAVTSIGVSAFYGCYKLTAISIPDAVESIGLSAFAFCTELNSVTIGAAVTSIGESAFAFCTELNSITIGAAVTSIGDHSFQDCSNLTEVTLNWAVPLPINSTVFLNVTLGGVALNVPEGTVSTYEAAAVWANFSPIQDCTLSTNENNQKDIFSVYPNPASDFISVAGLKQTTAFEVYNILGAKVLKGSLSATGKTEVQPLTKGVYFLKLDGGTPLKFIKK